MRIVFSIRKLIDGRRSPFRWLCGASEGRAEAVSYTHLDVYKRQVTDLRHSPTVTCTALCFSLPGSAHTLCPIGLYLRTYLTRLECD